MPSGRDRAGWSTLSPSTIKMSGRRTLTWRVRHDVVDQMAVDRGHHLFLAGLDVDHEAQQSAPIIGLRETLAMDQPAAFQLGIGEQEAVGGDQADPRMFRPDGAAAREAAGRWWTSRRRPTPRCRSRTAYGSTDSLEKLVGRLVQLAGVQEVAAQQPVSGK